MGEQETQRIFTILDTIREQMNRLLGRMDEKEKRCESHGKEMDELKHDIESIKTKQATVEIAISALNQSSNTSNNWITHLIAGISVIAAIAANVRH